MKQILYYDKIENPARVRIKAEKFALDHYASTWNRFIENSKLADMPVGQVKTSTLVGFFEDIGNEKDWFEV